MTFSSPASAQVRTGRDIAYIGSKPQSSLDPTMPVGSQIAEKLHSVRPEWGQRECRERVMQLLSEVRIPSPKERYWDYPAKFSGGMMQRAMIVDAICAEPAVLIADNVTQPLDVTIAAQIVALLHDLCLRHRMATIYLSSSLPTLGQFGDRTAVLHQGRLVEQQAFAELLASPQIGLYAQGHRQRSADVVDGGGAACPASGAGRGAADAGAEGPPDLSRPQARHLQLLQQCPGGARRDIGHHAAREFRHCRRIRLRQIDIDPPAGLAGDARPGQHPARRHIARRPVGRRTDPQAERVPALCCRIPTMRCRRGPPSAA